jgi:hypothetical protein
VDTDLDETDPADGLLSVREAFQTVNDPAQEGWTVDFAAPYASALSAPLPPARARGTRVAGRPGVVLDFAGAGPGACLTLAGPDQHLVGVEARGCAGPAVVLSGTGAHVADSTLACAPGAAACVVAASSGSGTIGAGNDVSGAEVGVLVLSGAWIVDGNRVHGSGVGIRVDGPAVVQRNEVFANGGDGLEVGGLSGATVRFNVLDANGHAGAGSGITVGRTTADVELRGNLLTRNRDFGVAGDAGSFAALDHDGFFANLGGAVSPGLYPTESVAADPLYVDAVGGDYRLLPGSPAIDAGVDLALDLNGPAPGAFTGAAPDLGAHESPYP